MPNATTLLITTHQPNLNFVIQPSASPAARNSPVVIQYSPGPFQNLSRARVHVFRQGVGSFLGGPVVPPSSAFDAIAARSSLSFSFDNAHPFAWIACGDSTDSRTYEQLIQAYSIQLFLGAPAPASSLAAMWLGGCFTVTLSPQTDPNPPHNVHPMIDVQGSWDALNPFLSILNPSNLDVDLFVRMFEADGGTCDGGPLSFVTPFNAYQVSLPSDGRVWYGFANQGQYATPADYFTAHPWDPSGGHHTQQIPQNSGG